jgi:hypothetical protein
MTFVGVVQLLLAIGLTCAAQQSGRFDGTWVLRQDGANILKITLVTKDGKTSGSVTIPNAPRFNRDGRVLAFGPGHVTRGIETTKIRPGQTEPTLELGVSSEIGVIVLKDDDHAKLGFTGLPWKLDLERVADEQTLILTDELKVKAQTESIGRFQQPPLAEAKEDQSARVALDGRYPPEIAELRVRLRAMVEADQNARLTFDKPRMQAVDDKNRDEVIRIFERYGWITNSLGGKDAAHDFWLLIQHQTPAVQRRLLPALDKAAKAGDAAITDYVYLYDRVEIGLGRPQRWGSQTQCVDGKPALYPVDDPGGLDARRKELSLTPIDEYLKADPLIQACAQLAK